MPFRGIILLIILAVLVAWFAKDEIFGWLNSNKEENEDDEDDEQGK